MFSLEMDKKDDRRSDSTPDSNQSYLWAQRLGRSTDDLLHARFSPALHLDSAENKLKDLNYRKETHPIRAPSWQQKRCSQEPENGPQPQPQTRSPWNGGCGTNKPAWPFLSTSTGRRFCFGKALSYNYTISRRFSLKLNGSVWNSPL